MAPRYSSSTLTKIYFQQEQHSPGQGTERQSRQTNKQKKHEHDMTRHSNAHEEGNVTREKKKRQDRTSK